MEPVTSDMFDGVRLCAKSGSFAFQDFKQISPGETECPIDFVACSEDTSLENTLCVKESKKEECPITEIRIIQNSQLETFSKTTDNVWIEAKT